MHMPTLLDAYHDEQYRCPSIAIPATDNRHQEPSSITRVPPARQPARNLQESLQDSLQDTRRTPACVRLRSHAPGKSPPDKHTVCVNTRACCNARTSNTTAARGAQEPLPALLCSRCAVHYAAVPIVTCTASNAFAQQVRRPLFTGGNGC